MFKWLVNFYTPYLLHPEGDSGGGDDLDVLGDITDDDKSDDDKGDKDDDKEDDKEEESDDDKSDDDEEEKSDEDEEESDEDEEEQEEEDDPEETEVEDRISHVKDIKSKYPKFFKDFPDVKAALFRDERYAEILGSPKEAENIVNKAGILDQIDEDLTINGDPKRLMETIAKNSKESFTKIAYNFLPTLANIDKEAYLEVAAVPIKALLRNMVSKFDPKSNEYKAAMYVHQYFFDNLNVNDKVKAEVEVKSEKSAKEKEYEDKIRQIDERDATQFFEATNTSYVTKLSKEIRSSIESDDRLTEFMKGVIVEKALARVKSQLDQDPRFKRQMEALWAQAKSSGYSNDLKSRIILTALARAKSLVPKERAKLLAEALGKKSAKNKEDKDDKVTTFKPRNENKDGKTRQKSSDKPLTDIDLLRGRG